MQSCRIILLQFKYDTTDTQAQQVAFTIASRRSHQWLRRDVLAGHLAARVRLALLFPCFAFGAGGCGGAIASG